MGRRPLFVVCFMPWCFWQVACSSSDAGPKIKDKVPLSKVTGTVLVDGTETSGVILRYKPVSEIAEKREMFTRGFTVRSFSKGKFALKTYQAADGVPAGEYHLYCEYYPSQGDDPRRTSPDDLLGGEYSEPNKPAKVFSVEPNKPLDLGTIELKTVPKT